MFAHGGAGRRTIAPRRVRGGWSAVVLLTCAGLALGGLTQAAGARGRARPHLLQPSGDEGRATRTVVMRPTSVVPSKWKESGSGFGDIVEPQVEESDYWAVAPRHK